MRVLIIKKTILILSFCIFICFDVCAAESVKTKIELIERETNILPDNSLSDEQRIKNAEIYVFGEAKYGDLQKRINNLSAILGLNADKDNKNEETIYEIENDSNANYPAVDNIEKQIFGSTYEKENIYKRLERLEKKLLGKVSQNSLNERVSALQEKIKPSKISQQPPQYNSYEYEDYTYYSPNKDFPEISIMEEKLFGKNYENENIPNRLSRLEKKLFNKTFDSDREDIRTERIKSVYKAAKSGTEYKVNKFAKYAIAGAQIGGILLMILAMIL